MIKKTIILAIVLVTCSYLVYRWISSLPPTMITVDPQVPMTVKTGDRLFWGKGTCHVCHRIGERGYALRGPNLGEGKEGAMIPHRAQQRAKELGLKTAADYIVQSIAKPDAFIVPGYNNEMPRVFAAPVSLYPSEIKAIIIYLLSLDGDTTDTNINLPPELLAYYQSGAKAKPFKITGDVYNGHELFFDMDGPAACLTCHVAINSIGKPAGRAVGPNLSAVALIRSPEHLYYKIIKPDSNIVSGYEDVLIKTAENQFYVGIILEESEKSLVIQDRNGGKIHIEKNKIKARIPQKRSNMPMNYAELLTERQIQDIVAFLLCMKY